MSTSLINNNYTILQLIQIMIKSKRYKNKIIQHCNSMKAKMKTITMIHIYFFYLSTMCTICMLHVLLSTLPSSFQKQIFDSKVQNFLLFSVVLYQAISSKLNIICKINKIPRKFSTLASVFQFK